MIVKPKYTKNQILQKIKKIKYLSFSRTSVNCDFDKLHYKLILLTDDCVKDTNIIKLLAKWRKKHEFWFPAQFKITAEGTKIWLKQKVIDTVDRLLFIIQVDSKYIGHVGLFRFNFDKSTCEIDNIIRGESPFPGIITNAITYMMDWGKKELGLKGYTLETSSDNLRALKLYKRLGFIEFRRIPAIHVKRKDRMEWIEAPQNYKGIIKRYFVFMELKNLD